VLIGALAFVPMLVPRYPRFVLSLALVNAIAAMGVNLSMGYAGLVSVGHAGFAGVGAYATALLLQHGGLSYWLALVVGALFTAVVGFLIGIPALRLEGLYLAIATFSLALAVPQILKRLDGWTGGSQGIVLAKPRAPFGLPLTSDQWLYFLTLGVLVLLFVLCWNLLRGRTGRAIVAIRDNPIAAGAMGINGALYKSLTFGISAGYTGVAGALGGLVVAFVAPDTFNVFLSITFLVGIVVGGLGGLSGLVFGAIFVAFLPLWAQGQDLGSLLPNRIIEETQKPGGPAIVYGVVLILLMFVLPNGVGGLFRRIGQLISSRRYSRSE